RGAVTALAAGDVRRAADPSPPLPHAPALALHGSTLNETLPVSAGATWIVGDSAAPLVGLHGTRTAPDGTVASAGVAPRDAPLTVTMQKPPFAPTRTF